MSCDVRKPDFCICENKAADQLCGYSCAVIAQLISGFIFTTWIVQSLYFLNPKFRASIHFQWLYSPVYIGPGRRPRRPGFLIRRLIYRPEDQWSCETPHLIFGPSTK